MLLLFPFLLRSYFFSIYLFISIQENYKINVFEYYFNYDLKSAYIKKFVIYLK